jgi:hypothetical protein
VHIYKMKNRVSFHSQNEKRVEQKITTSHENNNSNNEDKTDETLKKR